MKTGCEIVELDPDFSDPSMVVPLPDYSVRPKSHVLRDKWNKLRYGEEPEDFFYCGALAALNYLDDGQSSSQENLVERARALIHECQYYLGE